MSCFLLRQFTGCPASAFPQRHGTLSSRHKAITKSARNAGQRVCANSANRTKISSKAAIVRVLPGTTERRNRRLTGERKARSRPSRCRRISSRPRRGIAALQCAPSPSLIRAKRSYCGRTKPARGNLRHRTGTAAPSSRRRAAALDPGAGAGAAPPRPALTGRYPTGHHRLGLCRLTRRCHVRTRRLPGRGLRHRRTSCGRALAGTARAKSIRLRSWRQAFDIHPTPAF